MELIEKEEGQKNELGGWGRTGAKTAPGGAEPGRLGWKGEGTRCAFAA